MTVPAIETNEPGEGTPDPDATLGEWSAWNMRRRLPSEHAHRPAVKWPQGASDLTGIPEPTLKKMRTGGNHPRLYAVGRAMFTTIDALREWIEAHELAPGTLMRQATIPRGTKRPARKAANSPKVAA